jgi:hypothetical protein
MWWSSAILHLANQFDAETGYDYQSWPLDTHRTAEMNQLSFTDYDAFAVAVREASMTMRLTSLEEPIWTLQNATVGSLRLQQGFEGGGSIAEGATVGDGWAFYQQSLPVHVNGKVATQGEVFAVPPGGEFCLACQPRHEWRTVVIPPELLFQDQRELELSSAAKPQLLKPPSHVTKRFISLVSRFLSVAESKPQVLISPVAVDSFQNELVDTARSFFSWNKNSENTHFVRWRCQTKSALELVTREPGLSLSVSDLAKKKRCA